MRALWPFLVIISLTVPSVILGAPGAARAQTRLPQCDAPADALGEPTPLPNVATALKPGHTLRVLAIGSASVFGPEASLSPGSLTAQAINGAAGPSVPQPESAPRSPSPQSFPQQMAVELERLVPTVKVSLTIRGGRGLSAAEQLQLLKETLAQDKFNLIIWQTGTVEAVRNVPPAEFAEALSEGAARAREADADLVLIDPQFSRFLQTNANVEPYQQVFQQIAAMPNVLLFHRFDLMRAWIADGRLDLEHTSKSDRKEVAAQLHACLGAQLARMIVNGSRL